MKLKLNLLALAGLLTLSGCNKFNDFWDHHPGDPEPKTKANVAIDWYRLQFRIMLGRNAAFNGSQLFGYLGIGLYEAVRHESPHSVGFTSAINTMPAMPAIEDRSYDWELTANAAMAAMLRSFDVGLTAGENASIDSLEKAYQQKSSTQWGSEKFSRSETYGRQIAAEMYNWFLTDNYNASNAGYVPPVFPGAWVPTPPAFLNGIMPYLSTAKLFVAADKTVEVPPPPFPYSEDPGSDFYNMVKEVYDVHASLTDEQKSIALFYNDQGNGLGYTPQGHDFFIVTEGIEAKKVGLLKAAETLAKCGIAERDGTIICFTAKYARSQMRPVTYIQNVIEKGWLPLLITPPHPEYPAAHALLTGSVMNAAASVLGDAVKFTDHAYDFRGWQRSYTSFSGIAAETGMSRLYGGIHYRKSIEIGLAVAKTVGANVGSIAVNP